MTSSIFYNLEIAKDPITSPDILKKILDQGKSDEISCEAAKNPNCPIYCLERILSRNEDDFLSHYAIHNPKCPFKLLKKVAAENGDSMSAFYVLNRYSDPEICDSIVKTKLENVENCYYRDMLFRDMLFRDMLFENAVRNCSLELLGKVLEKYSCGEPFEIASLKASQNYNCTPEILEMIVDKNAPKSMAYMNARYHRNLTDHAKKKIQNAEFVEYVESKSGYKPKLKKIDCSFGFLNTCFKNYRKIFDPLKRSHDELVEIHRSYFNDGKITPEEMMKIVISGNTAGKEDEVKEVVKRQDCPPEVLAKSLEKILEEISNNCLNECSLTIVTRSAFQNPNCPHEIRKTIIDNFTKQFGIKKADINENDAKTGYGNQLLQRNAFLGAIARCVECPIELLLEIYKENRGNNIAIRAYKNLIHKARHAARNPNCPPEACPPEALKMVLERRKNKMDNENGENNKIQPQ